MVISMPRNRAQAVAFNRVANKTGRYGILRREIDGLEHSLDIVPPQVRDRFEKRVIVRAAEPALELLELGAHDRRARRNLLRDPAEQVRAELRTAARGKNTERIVRRLVQPPPELRPSDVEGAVKLRTVLQCDYTPAVRAKHLVDASPGPIGRHAIQALPVVVDKPPIVAKLGGGATKGGDA